MTDSNKPLALLASLLLFAASVAHSEDGHRLWLRYDPVPRPLLARYIANATEVVVPAGGSIGRTAADELERALPQMLGSPIPVVHKVDRDGAIALALSGSSELHGDDVPMRALGSEGFVIRSTIIGGHRTTLIAANSNAGLTYGAFAILRRMQMHQELADLDIRDRPALPLRMLDHWDNLDGTIERGYSGASLWDWKHLPDAKDVRYREYARANASIGLNGVVLNNVNADPQFLTSEYLRKIAALAEVFRPFGIRIFLSVRFSSPMELGGLSSADPANASVRAWWRAKVDEIYSLIPDFGGFVVKANSEGQPGPQDYGRTHADGANVIADALGPHGGTVVWRAFVYGSSTHDRAMQAYEQFKPLDGKFRDNVVLQVKLGPIDFQPREPFHPLFGQMPKTHIALEAQITREYLGQDTGLVYLAPMWTEVLGADTCSPACGSPVSATLSAIAGVSNVGSDANWTGTHFDQANWYAFGRLAWDPKLSARKIAQEWARMTWTDDPAAVRAITAMMLGSHEAVVDFMTPLGLAHQMATDHHYGPAPWVCDLMQPSWNPCYYNRADRTGIGFDRVSGPLNAVSEYSPIVARHFTSLHTVPDKYLLWFHHLPWSYPMRSGRTLWTTLIMHYDAGVREVSQMRRTWRALRPYIDVQRWRSVSSDLRREQSEARWWRDASIAYFKSVSGLPLPARAKRPSHSLAYYERLRPPRLPGQRR